MDLQSCRNDKVCDFFFGRKSKMPRTGRKSISVLFLTMAAARHLTSRLVLVKTDSVSTKAHINDMGDLFANTHCP